MIDELNNIKNYILNNYKIDSTIEEWFIHEYRLIIRHKKYDLTIYVTDPSEDNYLNGKKGIGLDYQANKKYCSKLNYEGGGCLKEYKNFDELDKFLSRFGYKKQIQMTIFDLI